MSDNNDDISDEDTDEAVRDFDRLTDLLFERVSEFADEEDVADDLLPLLLLRLSLTMRMMAYTTSVAKPSGGGLKLDLDRFRREVEEILRAAKKDADRYIATVRRSSQPPGSRRMMTRPRPERDEIRLGPFSYPAQAKAQPRRRKAGSNPNFAWGCFRDFCPGPAVHRGRDAMPGPGLPAASKSMPHSRKRRMRSLARPPHRSAALRSARCL
jgi:hypothetical protein